MRSLSYKLVGAKRRLTGFAVRVFSFAFKTAKPIIWQTTACSLMSKPSKQLMGNSACLPCGEIPMHEVHFLKIFHAGCYLRGHVNQCAETATRRTGSVTSWSLLGETPQYTYEAFVASNAANSGHSTMPTQSYSSNIFDASKIRYSLLLKLLYKVNQGVQINLSSSLPSYMMTRTFAFSFVVFRNQKRRKLLLKNTFFSSHRK